MERTILLRDQNNFVEILKIMSDAAENFTDILATSLSVLIILII